MTALDFMHVQLNLDYRKEWDSMSVDLNIFDSEPITNSDLIYWELRWPVIIVNSSEIILYKKINVSLDVIITMTK